MRMEAASNFLKLAPWNIGLRALLNLKTAYCAW